MYREVGFNLNDKPQWLAAATGGDDAKALTSPCLYFKERWMTNSEDILKNLAALFPPAEHAMRPHVLATDPPFIEFEVVLRTLTVSLYEVDGRVVGAGGEPPLAPGVCPF